MDIFDVIYIYKIICKFKNVYILSIFIFIYYFINKHLTKFRLKFYIVFCADVWRKGVFLIIFYNYILSTNQIIDRCVLIF